MPPQKSRLLAAFYFFAVLLVAAVSIRITEHHWPRPATWVLFAGVALVYSYFNRITSMLERQNVLLEKVSSALGQRADQSYAVDVTVAGDQNGVLH